MKNHPLREIAKFAAGLVAADFLSLVWFSQQHMLPVKSMGITFTSDMVLPVLLFDIVLFMALVHYGWTIGKIPTLREKSYLTVAGTLFTVVAALHLWRLITSTSLSIAGWEAPLWLSWIGVVVTAYLAYASFHFAVRMKK